MTIGSSGTINSTNIASKSYANLYNLINNRTNVPDPNDSTGLRKFVYQRIPKIESREFKGYPFIVVRRSSPNKTGDTANKGKGIYELNFMITVYTQDNTSDSSGNPSGASMCEDISDDIIKTLDSPTNQLTFVGYNMGRLRYTMTSEEGIDFEGNFTIYSSEFKITFENAIINRWKS